MKEYEIKPSLVSRTHKFRLSETEISREIIKKNKYQKLDLATIKKVQFYTAFDISELILKSENNTLSIRGPHINVEKGNFENKRLEFINFSNELIDLILSKNPNCIIKLGNPILYYMSVIIAGMLLLAGIIVLIGLLQGKSLPLRGASIILFVLPAAMWLFRSKIKPKIITPQELKAVIGHS